MTRSQRIVCAIYCLLIVYCCVWVPWRVIVPSLGEVQQGYDWIWAVGCEPPIIASQKPDLPAEIGDAKPIDPAPNFEVVDRPPPSPCHGFKSGGPDVAAVALRLLAVTALCGTGLLMAGKWKNIP